MNRDRLAALFRKDGLLIAAILLCTALCLLSGAMEAAPADEETRISRVLSDLSGAGVVEVALYREDAVPTGAVVVADGADTVTVRLRLTSALSALLGLPPERIAVYPREGGS